MMLTDQQQALYAFLKRYNDQNLGIGPTFDEMKDAVGLASKSGIYRLLSGLEDRGFVRRIRGKARAIEVLSRAPADREQRLREAATAIVDRFGREAANGYVSNVPPEMIQAVREALR